MSHLQRQRQQQQSRRPLDDNDDDDDDQFVTVSHVGSIQVRGLPSPSNGIGMGTSNHNNNHSQNHDNNNDNNDKNDENNKTVYTVDRRRSNSNVRRENLDDGQNATTTKDNDNDDNDVETDNETDDSGSTTRPVRTPSSVDDDDVGGDDDIDGDDVGDDDGNDDDDDDDNDDEDSGDRSTGSSSNTNLQQYFDPDDELEEMEEIVTSPYIKGSSAEKNQRPFVTVKQLLHQPASSKEAEKFFLQQDGPNNDMEWMTVLRAYQLIDRSGMVYSQHWQQGSIHGEQLGKIPNYILVLILQPMRFVKASDTDLSTIVKELDVPFLIQSALEKWEMEDDYPLIMDTDKIFHFHRRRRDCFRCALFLARLASCSVHFSLPVDERCMAKATQCLMKLESMLGGSPRKEISKLPPTKSQKLTSKNTTSIASSINDDDQPAATSNSSPVMKESIEEQRVTRKRGRPLGSKNKKASATSSKSVEAVNKKRSPSPIVDDSKKKKSREEEEKEEEEVVVVEPPRKRRSQTLPTKSNKSEGSVKKTSSTADVTPNSTASPLNRRAITTTAAASSSGNGRKKRDSSRMDEQPAPTGMRRQVSNPSRAAAAAATASTALTSSSSSSTATISAPSAGGHSLQQLIGQFEQKHKEMGDLLQQIKAAVAQGRSASEQQIREDVLEEVKASLLGSLPKK